MSEERTIVSDTGPLISLEKLTDGFGLIRLLYDTILISPTVLKELEEGVFNEGISYLDHHGISGLIEIVEMPGARLHAMLHRRHQNPRH